MLQSSKVEWIEESRLNKTWTRKGKDNCRETKSREEVEGHPRVRVREREKVSKRKDECENKGERKKEREAEQGVSQQ